MPAITVDKRIRKPKAKKAVPKAAPKKPSTRKKTTSTEK
jgi:hypothetical protein